MKEIVINFGDMGKVLVVQIGMVLLFHSFAFSYSNGKQEPESKRQSLSSQEERATLSKKIPGEILKNDILHTIKAHTISEPFEQKILPRPSRIDQKIIYEGDKKGQQRRDLNRKVDSSIYFATLVIVILAFILQGLRIWLSQLKQNWFVTMDSGIIKENPVRDKLIRWFEEVERRRDKINGIFGFLYLVLLLSLILVAITLITSRQPYNWLRFLIFGITIFFVGGIGTVVFGYFTGQINPVRINCTNYGGIAESLRTLQKEAVIAAGIKQGKINNKQQRRPKKNGG
jgi:hypothetical protein